MKTNSIALPVSICAASRALNSPLNFRQKLMLSKKTAELGSGELTAYETTHPLMAHLLSNYILLK